MLGQKLNDDQAKAFKRAKAWANDPAIDSSDRDEIAELIETNNYTEITERFYKDLEFGTGGMRSLLGIGSNRINKYTIRRAALALAKALKESSAPKKIAISYDSRKYSYEFAKEAASVFCAQNIESYIFKRLNPVPLLSFAIRHHGAGAGVMVTASHNPAEYNGFKVFWQDGAQVTPPVDKQIISKYNQLDDLSKVDVTPFEEGVERNLIHWMGEETENAYHEKIKTKVLNPQLCQERGHELKIVYTPLHGAALIPCTRALKDIGLDHFHIVQEQANPDHNFSTVKSPNPENPEALKMAVDMMIKEKADIVMGSDPDGDRLGVAFQKDGQTQYLGGNQIGVLMLHYFLTNLKEKNQLPENSYFVKTIVTTDLQSKIADKFGVATENTLTGFKWICRRVEEILASEPSRHFLFGTEESFGYLNHDYIRDKDGVSSLNLMAELALWYKTQSMDLQQALDKIYEEYGFYDEHLLNLNYLGKEGAEKIQRIMEFFRNFKEDNFGEERIHIKRDYQSLLEYKWSDSQETPLENIPASNVLAFIFEDQSKVFLRPSGTEPKIKFYLMIQEQEGELEQKKERTQQRIQKLLEFIHQRVENI